MTSYLIDTNHASKIMGNADEMRDLLTRQGQTGDRFYISVTVLGELYYAAYASRKQAYNLRNINNLLRHVPVLDFDQNAAEEYGRISAELKTKGRPIPGTDVQIAAVARWHNLTILTTDRHFRYIDNLAVENWL